MYLRPFCLVNTSYHNRSNKTSEIELPVLYNCLSTRHQNSTMDEQQGLKRLKTNDNIVILPAEKREVTVLWTRKTTTTKWTLVSNKQTYTHTAT